MPKVAVCFVCLGNICRSPTAEGVMRHLARGQGIEADLLIDSAGTSAYHVGEAPDRRATQAARRRSIVLSGASRQFVKKDFARFDWVLAMDRENQSDLIGLAPDAAAEAKIHLFRSFDPHANGDLDTPDPYYGGDRGFETVIDICERACLGLIERLRAQGAL
ncbi:MAG: low molecular weight protein-tyrosine-phosphatase [Polyangiaceae bacterium]